MSREKKVLPAIKVYAPQELTKQWFVYWYEGKKRVRKYGDINTYDTADERLQAAQQLAAELTRTMGHRVTSLEEDILAFLEDNKIEWKKKTLQQYTTVARMLIEYLEGRELTKELLDELLLDIRKTRHPTTYNRYVVMMRRMVASCGLGHFFEDVKAVKAEKEPAKYFQDHQAKRLMQLIDEEDAELGLFVRFVYYCFIRPGELRLLKVGDVLLGEKQIRVPGKISKNGKTQHVVIPEPFLKDLAALYHRGPGEYLFPSPLDEKKPIGSSTMYRAHSELLNRLGFGKGYSLYSWKHTGAIAVAKSGRVGVKELQLQLRHHSLDQTDQYLRQMGVNDLDRLQSFFPTVWE